MMVSYEYLVKNATQKGWRASTTAHRRLVVFPEGVLFPRIDPPVKLGSLNKRRKKTALLSGAGFRYE
jgi:hypothetical protein